MILFHLVRRMKSIGNHKRLLCRHVYAHGRVIYGPQHDSQPDEHGHVAATAAAVFRAAAATSAALGPEDSP